MSSKRLSLEVNLHTINLQRSICGQKMLRSLTHLHRVGRTYVVWNPDAETKSLFTKAIFNVST
jgi:hypothetical protein